MKLTILSVSGAIGLAAALDTIAAPSVSGNARGVAYKAVLTGGTETSIEGSILIKSARDGAGVLAFVDFSGFPGFDDSNYVYHIHAKRVPEDGNCTSTGPHFDPYHAGATSNSPTTYKCDPTKPELCELGDLAGKHGNINKTSYGPPYRVSYLDTFLSTTEGDTAFFGNLSVVVHRQVDNKRLRCGNFNLVKKDYPDSPKDNDEPTGWESWDPTTAVVKPTSTKWADWDPTTAIVKPTSTKWADWDPTTAIVKPTSTKWADWDPTTAIVKPTSTKWADWDPTTAVVKPATSEWANWESTSAVVKPVSSGWSDWASTTYSVKPTGVAVYTGSASLMSSSNLLSISSAMALVLAALL